MKNSLFLSFVLLLSFQTFCWSQSQASLFIEGNFNTFSHSDLLDFQQELVNDIGSVSLRSNDEFDPSFGFTIGFKSESNTQFFFSYMTTGAKNSYSDDTGAIRITQDLKGFSVGAEHHFAISNEERKNRFYFGLRGLAMYNSLEVSSSVRVFDSSDSSAIRFNGFNLGAGGRLIYEIPVSFFKLRISAGYDLVLSGKILFEENSDFRLENNNGEDVKTGWSGFRTGLGIVIPVGF
jgi:hypothetical protein